MSTEQKTTKPRDSGAELKQLRVCRNLFNIGLAAGMIMNADAAIWYQRAQETLKDQQDNERPPRPPRRPNVPLGRIAVQPSL